MLTAARELFAQRGFAATTTREIADRAGVDEVMLFRNYGSKERLFQVSVAEPIATFMNEYSERWLSAPLAETDPERILRAFVESLYDLVVANRELLMAAIPNHLGHGAQRALSRLEDLAEETARIHGFSYDSHVAIRAAVGMVITTCLFDEPLFGRHDAVPRERVVRELTGILTYGLTQRPPQ